MSNDPMAEIRASFFVECEELLESLQDSLNLLDEGDSDPEIINIVFRAVHSIKGGAGAFGLNALVAFAHRFETVMDEVRSGRMEVTSEATKLFFAAADKLQDHVACARDESGDPEGSEEVLKALEALLGDVAPVEEEVVEFTPAGLSFDFDLGDADEDEPEAALNGEPGWLIEFTPQADLYRSGNEALLILRSLARLGQIRTECLIPELPEPSPELAEAPLLTWRIRLTGDARYEDVREVFDFVSDVCELSIEAQEFPTDMMDLGAEVEPATAPFDAAAGAPAPAPAKAEEPVSVRSAPAPTPAPLAQDDSPMTQVTTTLEPRVPAAKAAEPKADAKTDAKGDSAGATVRVDLDKIDRLVNLVGELVINQAMLSQSVEEAGVGAVPSVKNGIEAFMMLTRDIQDSVMMIRAQPVKPLFQRMGRIVREASSSVGKEVKLRTEGEYTEVDKTVIERLSDPLTHMIRNAVDHGLEKPDVRRERGKPSEGVITLAAMHRAGRILIEVADDGAGINRPKVRDIAIQKGLISADAQLSDAEIDNLLFLPGFSTASQVSALSGRGVGMDVVKSAITALGGRISITSEPGLGTKFSISLPLTLAVLDGMVVDAAGQTLVVPLSAIVETARINASEITTVASKVEVMHIRGDFVPIIDLGVQLGFRPVAQKLNHGIVLLTSGDDGRRTALIVDAILDQRQVVIKGLSKGYGDIPGVAAATILGDGRVALILDPADLIEKARRTPPHDIALAG